MKLWGLFLLLVSTVSPAEPVRVGSKKFTESVILGEVLSQILESGGIRSVHRAELGGSRILWNALLGGDIDVYPEYTGTIAEILVGAKLDDLPSALLPYGIGVTAPLGFDDTYALGVTRALARRDHLESISDLATHPELKLGLSEEFRNRPDGWPRVSVAYGLAMNSLRSLDHDIAYRALQSGDIDIIDLYSTDAEIRYYDLLTLRDDRRVFPRYEAVVLYRLDLARRRPKVIKAIGRLEGAIKAERMIAMNARAKVDRIPAADVAAGFLQSELGVTSYRVADPPGVRLWRRLLEHLNLVVKSLIAAVVLAVPMGVLAAYLPRLGAVLLALVGIIQTFPALALLVILIRPLKAIGLPGIGDTPAIIALFLYSLLPILQNTYSGIHNIAAPIRESAEALGLPFGTRLWRIDLPLASPLILAGIQTAAVINVGFATLGALIGAGGFGQPILSGIRLDDYGLILEGAIPAALLAVMTRGVFLLAERWLVPRGIRRG